MGEIYNIYENTGIYVIYIYMIYIQRSKVDFCLVTNRELCVDIYNQYNTAYVELDSIVSRE